jgi:hypothetical protein
MLSIPGLLLLAGSTLLTAFISGILGMTRGMILMGVLLALAGTSLAGGVLERLSEASFRRWTRWTVFAMGAFYLSSGLLAAWS